MIIYKHETVLKEARKPAYGEKRDYPKIDIYAAGIYQCSTTWASTCKEAREHYKSPTGGNAKITARFSKD